MKLVSVVPTPNPDALKFTLGETLLKSGSKSFTSKEAASPDPLASKLFELEGVTSVFYMSNFVTVNKNPDLPWSDLDSKIQTILQNSENPSPPEEDSLLKSSESSSDTPFESMTPAEKLIVIDKLLDDEIRPGLAGDGGGLEVIGLEANTLQIHYEGACGSCPSATTGTLQYIETMLKTQLDDNLSVVPV